MTYQRYPMDMVHPNARQGRAIAVTEPDPVTGRVVTDYHGTPDLFPPVTVHNEDQEEEYFAKGYRPAGSPDGAAYADQKASRAPEGYSPSEFPKMVDGKLVGAPPGGYHPLEYPKWIDGVLCDTEAEAKEKFPAHFLNKPEVTTGAVIDPDKAPATNPSDELAALRAQIEEQALARQAAEAELADLKAKRKGGRPRKAPQAQAA